MANRRVSVVGYLFLMVILVAAGTGLFAFYRTNKKPKYLATAEYFVYLPGEDMPAQDALMDRCIKGGPYGQQIGTREGILFSDIRLHLGLILRSKNSHIFRPDTFEHHIEPTAEILHNLAEARGAIKVRYLSEEPLVDKRHLQLLPYLAEAVAVLGGGKVIFDVSAERLFSLADFQQLIIQDRNMTRAEVHLHVFTHPDDRGISLETRGLGKIGLQELRTKPIEADMRILAMDIMEQASSQVWDQGVIPAEVVVHAFDDEFQVQFDTDARPTEVQILRKRIT